MKRTGASILVSRGMKVLQAAPAASPYRSPAEGAAVELWQRRWPAIDSHEALLQALKEHLGFCTCAYDNAIPFLRDFLKLVDKRTNGTADSERFRQASAELEEFLRQSASAAVQSWFVYALEKADLITHGFNLYDILMMDRGWWLLDGLERFPEPPPLPDEEAGPGAAADGEF